jgi:hypothetical protein
MDDLRLSRSRAIENITSFPYTNTDDPMWMKG